MNKATLTFSALALISTSVQGQTKPKVQKPNIIFFLMDDLGYADIGCMGQEKIETPNIDALARSGKVLTQHYAGAPVSAPSRCVLLTGMHTGHAPIRGNDEASERGDVWSHKAMAENAALEGQRAMPATTITIAHLLRKAGYTTGCIGKWGLGAPGSDSEPNKMGFDRFFGYNCQRLAHSYFPPHLYSDSTRVYLPNDALQPSLARLDQGADSLDVRSYDKFRQKVYAPDLLLEQTMKFIDDNQSRPFFLWWTTPMPHVSLQAPQAKIDYYVRKFGDEAPFMGGGYYPARYPRATYAAMVSYIDDQIGAIIAKLKADNIYDNTIIVFTSDNGPTVEGGSPTQWFDSAYPFRCDQGRGKGSVYEGGLIVPTIVSWPGKIESGGYQNSLSAFWDWMPTLLDMADAKKLIPTNIDGLSMVDMLTGKKSFDNHQFLYWEFSERGGKVAVRQGDWKLIIEDVKSKTHKLMLFNIGDDPREQFDVAAQFPIIVSHLKALANQSHTAPTNANFALPFPL